MEETTGEGVDSPFFDVFRSRLGVLEDDLAEHEGRGTG